VFVLFWEVYSSRGFVVGRIRFVLRDWWVLLQEKGAVDVRPRSIVVAQEKILRLFIGVAASSLLPRSLVRGRSRSQYRGLACSDGYGGGGGGRGGLGQ